jgi:SAM-dependent methyltransferase
MPHSGHEQNRRLWNEIVEVHYRHPEHNVTRFVDDPDFLSLHPTEQEEMGDVTGQSLLHLQCQFGMDTLSWRRKGASCVCGVDISDVSIDLARRLQTDAGIDNADFVCSDVLELSGKLDRQFDIVFQSYGTYIWIADLRTWARVIAEHLKPGGYFYIIDQHPVWQLFGYPQENLDYFANEPTEYPGGVDPDYCDREYIPREGSVEWMHTMSEIVNSLITAGLRIDFLNEFPFFYYPPFEDWYEKDGLWYPPDGPQRYPMMFSLKATLP